MKRSGLAFMLMLLVAACGGEGDGVDIAVEVVTELVPGVDFEYIDVDLLSVTASSPLATGIGRKELHVTHELDYARGKRVAMFQDAPMGQVLVRVRLLRPDRTLLVSRRVRVNVAGDSSVRVQLTSDCVGVECPLAAGAGASAALSECLGGACVPDTCDPNVAGTCPSALPVCTSDGDCESAHSTCSEDRCVDHVCIVAEDESACSAGSYCNVDTGCEPLPESTLDAGMDVPDIGVVDEGVDMYTPPVDAGPNCGAVCELPDSPCLIGFLECVEGSEPVCSPLQPRLPGTPCGDGLVCDTGGRCATCNHGASCNGSIHGGNVCREYVVDCTLGGVCIPTDELRPVGSYCIASTGGAIGLCSSTGLCAPCIEDEICEAEYECQIGRRNCTGGGAPYGSCVAASWEDTGLPCGAEATSSCYYGGCAPNFEATAVDTGANSSYALLPDGTVMVWGQDRSASAFTRLTIAVPIAPGADHVATSESATCATRSGAIDCWYGGVIDGSPGWYNSFGVGMETLSVTLPVVDELEATAHTFCARSGGTIWCWGDAGGHCGTAPCTNVPTQVTGITDAVNLHMGDAICVVRAFGTVLCWNGDTTSSVAFGATPTLVPSLAGVLDITTGSNSACVVVATGATSNEVKCWGDAAHSVLGFDAGGAPSVATPTTVPLPFDDVIAVRSMFQSHCALRASGDLWCWGDYSVRAPDSPSRVELARAVRTLSEGGNCHACGTFEGGALFCIASCGLSSNGYGQLGLFGSYSMGGALVRDAWMVLQ